MFVLFPPHTDLFTSQIQSKQGTIHQNQVSTACRDEISENFPGI